MAGGKGNRAAQRKRYKELHPEKVAKWKAAARIRKREAALDYPFLDGESLNDEPDSKGFQKARLIYLSCYSARTGSFHRMRSKSPKGLRTEEILAWMCKELPGAPLKESRQQHSLIAWYFGGYDLTLILRDLPAWLHHLLLHPDKRRFKTVFDDDEKAPRVHPIRWKGFVLDWMNNMFMVHDGKRRIIIYDIARYYQCSFLTTLKDWKVGTPEELELIKKGKERRATFDESERVFIEQYCDLECRLGSEAWKKLRNAHREVGLIPKRWFGPGQTAKTMLTKMYEHCYGKELVGPGRGEVRWKREIRHARLRVPFEAWHAFAAAFFGGRFENSRYGVIPEKTYTADIASAYPFAIAQLPCLVHGEWVLKSGLSLSDLKKATLACVRYRMPASKNRERLHWAPLPFRDAKGSICFPVNSTGWAWLPEIEAAFALGFRPELLEAWVYVSKCRCPIYRGKPSVRELYGWRLILGKEGAGMVLKFALNSGYGVKAQVLGIHEARSLSPFQSFVEAGMITSITRAKLVTSIAYSPKDVLMVNTDSVTTLKPFPFDTTLAPEKTPEGKQKPELGAWDLDTNDNGTTLIKQGIYFDRDFKKLKARGIGRDVLQKNSKQVERALEAWIAGGPDTVQLKENRDVFHGQRQCTDGPRDLTKEDWLTLAYNANQGRPSKHEHLFTKRDYYGSWSRFKQQITFATLPKRERVLPDGRLVIRDMGGAESAPYTRALAIAEMLRELPPEALEDEWLQDFPDYVDM